MASRPRAWMVRTACVIAALAGLGGVGVGPAHAQMVSEYSEADYRALLNRHVADGYASIAFRFARETKDPTVDTYRLAANLLRMAHRLVPDDSDLLRSEIEAWKAVGDAGQELACTRELVRLDPRDTVAQLRLLTSAIAKLQDADARMAVYERLLGKDGAKFDESIRSRIALDAALLARETGDERGFLDKLTYAVTADMTNKEAAALFATYFLDRTSNPRERADILANVILADPLDADAHRNLAIELMRQGAYGAARRFYDRMGEIQHASGIEETSQVLFDYLLAIWNADGAARGIEMIRTIEARAQLDADKARQDLINQGYEAPPRQPVVIAAMLEMVRMAIFAARGDQQQALYSLQRTQIVSDATIQRMREDAEKIGPEEVARIDESAHQTELEMLWLRLLCGQEIDKAKETLEKLRGDTVRPLTEDALRRYDGWIAAHMGDTDIARDLLTPIAEKDANARFALAVCAEKEGKNAEAIEHYTKVAQAEPVSVLAGMARMRIERLQSKPLEMTPPVRELNDAMLAFAPWLDKITYEPRSYVSLVVEPINPKIDVLGRVDLKIRLRNEMSSSGIPLGVGPDRTINSRILLSPMISTSITQQSQLMRPEIVRLDRRLRLKPGESIETTFWGGRWKVGEVLDASMNMQATLRWRGVQGFKVTEKGLYEVGPLCVGYDSGLITREILPIPGSAGALADEIALTRGPDFMRTILAASMPLRLSHMQMLQAQNADPNDRDAARRAEILPQLIQERQIILSTLKQRLSSLDTMERAFVVLKLATAGIFSGEDRSEMLTLVDAQSDPFLTVAMMIALGGAFDRDTFVKASESNDPQVREIARLFMAMAEVIGQQGPGAEGDAGAAPQGDVPPPDVAPPPDSPPPDMAPPDTAPPATP